MSQHARLAERKALLVQQADLHRLQMSLAWRNARTIVLPRPSPDRSAWARPKVAKVLAFALPLFGARRLGRIVRVMSVALVGYRALRNWRS